jgi:hypothetical protein
MEYRPGQIGFCHSTNIFGKAIRFGERLRFRHGDFWNHVFIISDEIDSTGEPLIIQAISKGVDGSKPLSQVAPGGKYQVIELPAGVDSAKVLAFAKSQVGSGYGYISIASIVLQILLPRWLPMLTLRSKSTWICSALSAESARAGGWVHDWPDVYNVVPSELYAALSGLTLAQLKHAR